VVLFNGFGFSASGEKGLAVPVFFEPKLFPHISSPVYQAQSNTVVQTFKQRQPIPFAKERIQKKPA